MLWLGKGFAERKRCLACLRRSLIRDRDQTIYCTAGPDRDDPGGALKRKMSMFSTGIARSDGGIAAANRNVLAAMERVSARVGAALDVHILHESSSTTYRTGENGAWVMEKCHGGNQYTMGAAIGQALFTSRLVLFDHVHLAKPLASLSFFPRFLRAKTVICAHGSESWKRIKPSSIKAFQAADLTLTNSNYTLEHMRQTFTGFAGQACPLGLPPQFALTSSPPMWGAQRPVLTAADGTKRAISERAMLLVGRMDPAEQEKGHRELIRALPRVCREVADADLVFVGGGGDAQALAQIAAASPAAGRIFLAGRVDDDKLRDLYAAAYAYVMPSRQEGFGLVYLEAMNHALPCLACHDDGAADVVVDGETGLLVNQPIDDDELTAAIVELLSNPSRARAMGEAGWIRLHDKFTAEAHQSRMEAALESLLQ